MPNVAILRARSDREVGGTPVSAADMELILPSQVIHPAHCDAGLIEDEWKLRVTQASDILHELQRLLLIWHQLYRSKQNYGTGQWHHTRSITLIKNIQEKVDRAVQRYRAMRVSLVILADHLTKVGWDDVLQPLVDEDIRAPDEEDSISEGR